MGSGTRAVTAHVDGTQLVTLDWGDGEIDTDLGDDINDPNHSPVGTHTYTADGTFTIKATAQDNPGTSSARVTVPGAAARQGRRK